MNKAAAAAAKYRMAAGQQLVMERIAASKYRFLCFRDFFVFEPLRSVVPINPQGAYFATFSIYAHIRSKYPTMQSTIPKLGIRIYLKGQQEDFLLFYSNW